MRPNINTPKDDHRLHCIWPDDTPEIGDVRRCEHGIVQRHRHYIGMTSGVWVDLHPFWDFLPYRRAVMVLNSFPETIVYKKKPVVDSSWSRRREAFDWNIDLNLPVYTEDLLLLARAWTFDGERTLAELIEKFANDIDAPPPT